MVQYQKRNIPLVDRYISAWFEDNKTELDKNIRRVINTKYDQKVIKDNPFLKFFTTSLEKPIEILIKMQDGYDIQEKYYMYDEQYYKLIDVCYCSSCANRNYFEPILVNISDKNDRVFVTSAKEMSEFKKIIN